jgi:glutamine amidotransferase
LHEKVIKEKKPFLGICLGMQILFEKSEEGVLPGLCWIEGDVKRFDFKSLDAGHQFKVPHMGWNQIKPLSNKNLFKNLEDAPRFYFVHSYHVNCANELDVLATSNYGYDFVCSVRKGNIWGTQFHPEKSHKFGIEFFRNFLREVNCAQA